MSKALAVLKRILPMVEAQTKQIGYGFFPGGDPREFTPDEECSTPEEQAKWKADCEAYGKGEIGKQPSTGRGTHDEQGRLTSHLLVGGYGLGTYTYEDPEGAALVAEIREAIAELEQPGR